MALVSYSVLYKYAHPFTKKPITNTTSEKYDTTTRFIKAYSGDIDTAEILAQENAENQKYDMLFMYNGVMSLNNIVPAAIATGSTIMAEKFERCKGEAWFIASIHTSLQSALKAADPIAKAMGKTNVKVMKNVPLEITVGIE